MLFSQTFEEMDMLARPFLAHAPYLRVKLEGEFAETIEDAAEAQKRNFREAVSNITAQLINWHRTAPYLRPELGLPFMLGEKAYEKREGTAGNRHLNHAAIKAAFDWMEKQGLLVVTQKGFRVSSSKRSFTYIKPTQALLELVEEV